MRLKSNKINLQLAESFYQIELKDITTLLERNNIKVLKSSPAGSLRRKKRVIGDLDIVIEVDNPKAAGDLLEKHMNYKFCAKSAFYKGKIANTGIDLFIAGKYNFYAMLFFLTGSEDWNLKIMMHLKKNKNIRYMPFKFINCNSKKQYDFNSEEDIFKLIKHNYVLPEDRKPNNINFGE
jgi:DNA polymerase/3'-5' exonuclease PolX